MNFRIFLKSLKLAIRAKRRFILFTAIYAVLIGLTTYFWDLTAQTFTTTPGTVWFLILLIGITAVTAAIYGLILSGYRKTEVATLRCLGWSSSNIRTLFIGELFLVSVCAFFVDFEIAIHQIGLFYYGTGQTLGLGGPLFAFPWFIITFVIVLLVQIIGILVAYSRMLKIKPMEALRKV
ncbi:MAG: FtsX-like permease family protein [Candidatus Lokiarchaeota archaeon]|nr:FtsX-like permease family protein [Candidatus Lokiarchaeota archaeon]